MTVPFRPIVTWFRNRPPPEAGSYVVKVMDSIFIPHVNGQQVCVMELEWQYADEHLKEQKLGKNKQAK